MKGIWCFGDSVTFGIGELPHKGWCGRLKEFFEMQHVRHALVQAYLER